MDGRNWRAKIEGGEYGSLIFPSHSLPHFLSPISSPSPPPSFTLTFRSESPFIPIFLLSLSLSYCRFPIPFAFSIIDACIASFFAHSFVHSSIIHSFIHSFIHACMHSFMCRLALRLSLSSQNIDQLYYVTVYVSLSIYIYIYVL